MSVTAKHTKLATLTEKDSRWTAVIARAPSADGQFYYSVKTTGVYCRPSCPARLAKPQNVQFHDMREDAERAGFCPCKRCVPDQSSLVEKHGEKVATICRLIENSQIEPSLDDLAHHAGLSVYYFHRVFKAITGLTPKAYAAAHRANRVRSELDRSSTITAAIYGAGYNSNGRFYAASPQILGMTPSNYRAGGVNTEIHFAIGECSLGAILVAMSNRGVCAISLGDDPDVLIRNLQDRFPQAELLGSDNEFEQLIAKVVGFVETPALGLDLPLDVRGTAFQQRVWQMLREIPVGDRVSYSDIANRMGSPKSARAVAGACAANTLAVTIPCHRVVRNDGSLSGYRWGIERKVELLRRESKA